MGQVAELSDVTEPRRALRASGGRHAEYTEIRKDEGRDFSS